MFQTFPVYKNFSTSWKTSGRNCGFLTVYGWLEEYDLDHNSRLRLWNSEQRATSSNLWANTDASSLPTTKTTSLDSRSFSNLWRSPSNASTPIQVFPLPGMFSLPHFEPTTLSAMLTLHSEGRLGRIPQSVRVWVYFHRLRPGVSQSIPKLVFYDNGHVTRQRSVNNYYQLVSHTFNESFTSNGWRSSCFSPVTQWTSSGPCHPSPGS